MSAAAPCKPDSKMLSGGGMRVALLERVATMKTYTKEQT